MSGRRRAAAWLAVVVIVVVGVAGVAWWTTRGDPTPWDEVVATDGGSVRISYSGSVCRDDVRVDVDETDDQVRITLHEVVIATGCDDVAVPYEVDVTLDAPLGDRELVDGACGYEEPAGRPTCDSAVRTPTG